MRRYSDGTYRADKGKMFVLTEIGKTWASYKDYEVGKPIDEDGRYGYAGMVDDGALIEIDDPDWVTLPGYRVVYNNDGYELSAGNPIVFHDREMAERYMRGYQKYPWFDHELYIIDAVYEGKKPKPCRQYDGKKVYNNDYWTFYGAEIGDLVEENIVDDMIDAVPPACIRSSCMQCGEAADHKIDEKTGEGRAVYETFKKVTKDIYEYCGKCFRGENVERGKEIPVV